MNCSLSLWRYDDTILTISCGGFKYFLFSSLPGEMIQFDSYFSNGLLTYFLFCFWEALVSFMDNHPKQMSVSKHPKELGWSREHFWKG